MITPPTTTKRWTLEGRAGFGSLVFHDADPIPPLKDRDVLVHFHAVSLNYRDLVISKGTYTLPTAPSVVPASDGAGTVVAVGSDVKRFRSGDRVVTLFNQGQIAGNLKDKSKAQSLGGTVDGTLREYGAYDEENLVRMPETLDFRQAATLSCAGVTAWNALFGLEGTILRPGMTVLIQGSGGVSVFALQFAKAAGARIIATTSSSEKAKTLTSLGADHVLNYRDDPNWGVTAASLTPDKLGVDHVIEVGGPGTISQSLKAVRVDGCISIIGFVAGKPGEAVPNFLEVLGRGAVVRGVHVGSRILMDDMGRAIDAAGIKPIIDGRVFQLHEARDAYQYLWDQRHLGKVVIDID